MQQLEEIINEKTEKINEMKTTMDHKDMKITELEEQLKRANELQRRAQAQTQKNIPSSRSSSSSTEITLNDIQSLYKDIRALQEQKLQIEHRIINIPTTPIDIKIKEKEMELQIKYEEYKKQNINRNKTRRGYEKIIRTLEKQQQQGNQEVMNEEIENCQDGITIETNTEEQEKNEITELQREIDDLRQMTTMQQEQLIEKTTTAENLQQKMDEINKAHQQTAKENIEVTKQLEATTKELNNRINELTRQLHEKQKEYETNARADESNNIISQEQLSILRLLGVHTREPGSSDDSRK